MQRQKISGNTNQSKKNWFDYDGMVRGLGSLCDDNEIVLSLNRDGIIECINEKAALRRFNVKASKLIGKSVWEILEPEVAERRKSIFNQVLQSRKPVRFMDERRGSWLDSMVYPFFDVRGRIQRLFILGRDITHLKEKEKKIQMMNQELEQWIRERIGDLRKTNEQLEEEIQVADLTRYGKTTKDIAALFNTSARIVEVHREHIRKKLGVKNRHTNLRTYLLTLN
jgi:PAS domain S-box-containing protein